MLIVSFNQPELLRRCMAAVREHLPGEQIRIWDNRSPRTPEIRQLAAENPDVDWVFSEEGIGFGAGVNQLVKRSTEDTLLLNPDAVLTGPLARARAALAEPRVAAVSPLVIDPSGREEPWDVAHRRRGMVRILINHAGYARRLRKTPLSDLYPGPTGEVDGYLTGCCLLVSRAAWDDVGPFDERFFLYGEDSDWQRRATERGWRLRLVEEADVRHGEADAADAPPSPRSSDLLLANTALAAGKGGNNGVVPFITGGQLLLSRVQRSKRAVRARHAAKLAPDTAAGKVSVVLTARSLAPGAANRHRVLVANELSRRGHAVTIVCTDELGKLERQLHQSVRIALRAWWQPVVDVVGDAAVLISGDTRSELAIGAAWSRLPGHARRRWVRWADGPEQHLGPTVAPSLAFGRCEGVVTQSPVVARAGDPPRASAAQLPAERNGETPEHARPVVSGRRFTVPMGIDPQPEHDAGPGPLSIGVLAGSGPVTAVLATAAPTGPQLVTLAADPDVPATSRPWAARPAETFAGLHALCVTGTDGDSVLAALDAMACGVAVIAQAVGPFVDLLDNGGAGILVADPSPGGWAKAFAGLDREALAEHGRRARLHAEKHHPLEKTVDAYEEIIATVLR